MSSPELLERAAGCYFRAGAPAEAARCYLEARSFRRAAELFQQLGDHRQAALALTGDGRPEEAAWLLAEGAGDFAAARDLLPALGSSLLSEEEASWLGNAVTRARQLGTTTEGKAALLRALEMPDALDRLAAVIERILREKEVAIDAMDFELAAALRDIEKQCYRRQSDLRRRQVDRRRVLLGRLVTARCDVAERVPQHRILPVLAEVRQSLARPERDQDPRIEEWAVAVATVMPRFDQVALIFAAALSGQRPGTATRWQAWSERVLKVRLALPAEER